MDMDDDTCVHGMNGRSRQRFSPCQIRASRETPFMQNHGARHDQQWTRRLFEIFRGSYSAPLASPIGLMITLAALQPTLRR